MVELLFEWDEHKNISNQKKHNVSFEEAKTAFYDEEALLIPDVEHSDEEERFILLGISMAANLLIVCHCLRNENTIRIISARKATKNEEKSYNDRR